MRKTGTSSVCQSLVTCPVSCAMDEVMLMLFSWNVGSELSSLTALVSVPMSEDRTPAGLSVSSTVALPCSLAGALLKVASGVNSAS